MCKVGFNYNNFYIVVQRKRGKDLLINLFNKTNNMELIKQVEIKTILQESLKNKDFQNRIIKMLEL